MDHGRRTVRRRARRRRLPRRRLLRDRRGSTCGRPLPLWRLLFEWRPDVVHSWDWMSTLAALPLCRLLGIPIVDATIRNGTVRREGLAPAQAQPGRLDAGRGKQPGRPAGLGHRAAQGVGSSTTPSIPRVWTSPIRRPLRRPLRTPGAAPTSRPAVRGHDRSHGRRQGLFGADRSGPPARPRASRPLALPAARRRPRRSPVCAAEAGELGERGVVAFIDPGLEVLPLVREARRRRAHGRRGAQPGGLLERHHGVHELRPARGVQRRRRQPRAGARRRDGLPRAAGRLGGPRRRPGLARRSAPRSRAAWETPGDGGSSRTSALRAWCVVSSGSTGKRCREDLPRQLPVFRLQRPRALPLCRQSAARRARPRGHTVLGALPSERPLALGAVLRTADRRRRRDRVPAALLVGLVGPPCPGARVHSREVYDALSRELRDARPDVAYVLKYERKLSPSVLAALHDHGVPIVVRLSDFAMVCPQQHLVRDDKVCELCVGRRPWPSVRFRCVQGSFGRLRRQRAGHGIRAPQGVLRLRRRVRRSE